MVKNRKEAYLAPPEEEVLNLSDFALFLSVMKNREAYQCVLGIIMDQPNLRLAEVKVEQVVLNRTGKHAIRLDAWALDEDARIIRLNEIVEEVKQSEEWEEIRMSIYKVGLEKGREEGHLETLVQLVKQNLLKPADAARNAEMSEEEFLKRLRETEKIEEN